MSRFPKNARHPDIEDQIRNWKGLRDSINLDQNYELSEVPNLGLMEGKVQGSEDVDYSPDAREIVGANAIRVLAKSYEALDALMRCGNDRVNMSAIVQGYNVAFFAARAFCMLMGFSPLNRNSSITVDVFAVIEKRKGKVLSETRLLRLHKYKRWGHNEVWHLTQRLASTISVPMELQPTVSWLTRANLVDSSRLRNAFQYDDCRLGPLDEVSYLDFPDVASRGFFDDAAPDDVSHQMLVTQGLIQLCTAIVNGAGINHLLSSCASDRRVISAQKLG